MKWKFPEQLIHESFHLLNEFNFKDTRPTHLLTLATQVLDSADFETFQKSKTYNSEFGFQFFKDLDDRLSAGFIAASTIGNENFKTALKAEPGT